MSIFLSSSVQSLAARSARQTVRVRLPLSGLDDWRGQVPFASEYHGPAQLTGGVFGPEDSALMIVRVAAGLAATLYWEKPRN